MLVVLGVDNKKSEKILNFLRQEEKAAREKLSNTVISEHEFVAPWREVYRNFGSKPNEYSSSVEALAKRVQKDKELPDINPLVNLYNALSLKHLLPFGGEDLDKIKGDISLAFAVGTEKGKYIGSDKEDSCYPGEIAYLDDLGFICRRWNWREADRTKLTKETKNVVLVAEALPPISNVHFKKAIEELSSLLTENLGGKTSIFYLDQQNQILEIDFVTGTKLAKIEENAPQSKIVAKEKNKNLNAYLEIYNDINEQVSHAEEMFKNGTATSLTGIPFAIKDNILFKGHIASAGSKILGNYTATYEGAIITELKKQGVVILGRTNMDEFAMGSSTQTSAFGVTRNPYDETRVPGGSSGGSAAALAADMALVALGTETCGSVRQPSSFCGLVGLKPTYGALSRSGIIAMGSSLDQRAKLNVTFFVNSGRG